MKKVLLVAGAVVLSGNVVLAANVDLGNFQKQFSLTGNQAAATQQKVQDTATGVNASIQALLTKAHEYLNAGKFNEAIAKAQDVLKQQPQNSEAKGIIETAKAKIAEMAKTKTAEVKQNLINKINAFGK